MKLHIFTFAFTYSEQEMKSISLRSWKRKCFVFITKTLKIGVKILVICFSICFKCNDLKFSGITGLPGAMNHCGNKELVLTWQTGQIGSWNIVKVKKKFKELEAAFLTKQYLLSILRKVSSGYFNTLHESRRTFEMF